MPNENDSLIKHLIDNFNVAGDEVSYKQAEETFKNEVVFGEKEREEMYMKDYYETSDGSMEVPEIVDEPFSGMDMIKVLLVKALQKPQIVEIGSDLESMQEIVGGNIEEIMPFEEEVAIVCNEEGKILKLELNRAIRDQNGDIYDIIAGDFFVCSASGEEFGSLTDEQVKRYCELYKVPEAFVMTYNGIKVVPIY